MLAFMSASSAELSSMAAALEELGRRIEELAQHYQDDRREDLAGELFEAERGVSSAVRRLGRVAASPGA
jgi:hypothetical protein